MIKVLPLVFGLNFLYITSISQTVILHPVKDNTILSESGALSNAKGKEFYVGQTGSHAGNSKRRALIQFDVTSIPAGSVITGVTLSVTCTKTPSPSSRSPNPIELHRSLAAWGEGTSSTGGGNGAPASAGDATWTCRFANGTGGCTQAWATAGGDLLPLVSSTVTVNDIGTYTYASSPTLIADVQKWVDTSSINFGWLVTGDEVATFSARAFTSREDASLGPTLTVTYTAAPCTTNTWKGVVSSAWETPGNWSCGSVPGSNTNVIINTGTVVLNSNVTVKSVTTNAGVNFTVNAGFKLTVIR